MAEPADHSIGQFIHGVAQLLSERQHGPDFEPGEF
jgi:hypothetical protein